MLIRFIAVFLLLITGKVHAESSSFRFHLSNEPTHLSVYQQKNSSALYFLGQLNESLLSFNKGQLTGRLAESCKYVHSKKLECSLRINIKWSDGTDLTGSDFVRSFQNFIDPKFKTYRADLLLPLKNAKEILSGQKNPDTLGVSFKNNKLIFDLESEDSEFIYNLATPLLAPQKSTATEISKADSFISSGPYKIKSWNKGQKIILVNNPHYFNKTPRPDLEILFVSEDSVSLNLYEKNGLDFLRRVPTLFIEKFKSRKDFYEVDQFRFDYLGFGPALKDRPHLREALSQSLDYSELQKLFSAKAPPGCPGIPKELFNKNSCLLFNLEKAKLALLEDSKINKSLPKLDFYFSKQGGEDHKRALEWVQAQWRKNLNITVQLHQLENKIFVQKLETDVPALFRKGVNPTRPTCLSVLQTFTEDGKENYLKVTAPDYLKTVQELKKSLDEKKKTNLCQNGLDYLLSNHLIIPTGPIHFSVMAKPQFSGWTLNELNQLDLSSLKLAKP